MKPSVQECGRTCSGWLLKETKCKPWMPWDACCLAGEGGRKHVNGLERRDVDRLAASASR